MPYQGGSEQKQKYHDFGSRHKSIDKQNDLTKIYMVSNQPGQGPISDQLGQNQGMMPPLNIQRRGVAQSPS